MRTIICSVGTSIKDKMDKYPPNSEENIIKLSAETHSLFRLGITPDDRILLLSTETQDGYMCAENIKKSICSFFHTPAEQVEIKTVSGLQVQDGERFRREGLKSLCSVIIREKDLTASSNIIINTTGGFKGVVPFTTILGMIFGIRTVYIFEQSSALIQLPPMPITIDHDMFLRVKPALQLIEQESFVPETTFYSAIEGFKHTDEERLMFESYIERDCKNPNNVTMSSLALVFWSLETGTPTSIFYKTDLVKNPRFTWWCKHLVSPIWRNSKTHPIKGCELMVFKPGNTSDRAACIIEADKVYLCELQEHDEYERNFPGLKKSSYKLDSFLKWHPI